MLKGVHVCKLFKFMYLVYCGHRLEHTKPIAKMRPNYQTKRIRVDQQTSAHPQ